MTVPPTLTGSAGSPAAARPPAAVMAHVVPKHHGLVRFTHWVNVPLLFGLIASGLSIYWAAPVFRRATITPQQSRDVLMDLGRAIAGLLHASGDPRMWIYDHWSLGGRMLATALQLHWLLAYLFMLNGLLYVVGLAAGGGWRALLPRPSDAGEARAMIRYYLGVVPNAILRRPWPHPPVRGAYFTMPLVGALVVASGWAMHKPVQLGWLERLFVNYDGARVVHFACMIVLGSFVVPHVVLVIADGWDTFRSMVTGWSLRVKEEHHDGP